jgi:hypothetical protein
MIRVSQTRHWQWSRSKKWDAEAWTRLQPHPLPTKQRRCCVLSLRAPPRHRWPCATTSCCGPRRERWPCAQRVSSHERTPAAASVQGSSIGIDVTLDRDKTALYVTLTIRRRTWAVLGQHFSAHGGHESSPHRVCAVSAGQAVRKHRGNESGLAALLEQSLRVTRGALPVAIQLWLVLHVRGRSRGSGDQ